MPGCSLDAEPAVAEIDLIEIRFENLIFGIVPLHLTRRGLLAKFAGEAEITPVNDVGVHVPDELLSDRARATAPLAEELSLDRAGDADQVDTIMLIETLILDGDEGVREVTRQRSKRDTRAELTAYLTDE